MKLRYYSILGVLFTSLLSSTLTAQFAGGNGDGFTARESIQLDLTGVPAGVRPLYAGGRGDGFDHQTIATFLAGQDVALLYGGGSGDGFDRHVVSVTLSGQELAALYLGGSGDGFDRQFASVTLGGETIADLYGGGLGDGFDRGAGAGALNGQSLAPIFAGGSGDGFDRQAFNGVLNGATFTIYEGGAGDGFDRQLVSLSLSGLDLSVLYSGGDGDGFDSEIFFGVIPLPMTLVRFDAFPMKDYVLLKWETEDELDTDFFTIEKTRAGLDFSTVGTTEAAGFSEPGERLHYELEDHTPYTGTSYYRLKTTDFDGVISHSHLVAVNFSTAEDWDFTLFPNPNTGRQLGFRPHGLENGERLRFEILDVAGRSLLREDFSVDGRDHRFDLLKQLSSGTYLVRATDAEGKTRAKLLIVQ